jgi:hypothetical protein
MSCVGRILPLLLAGWMLPAGPTIGGDRPPLPPYQAEYRLDRDDTRIGRVDVSLAVSPQGKYTYRTSTRATGLAALFKPDEITETSRGHISARQVVPSSYQYLHERPDRPRRVELTFDWENRRVLNRTTDSEWSMKIPKKTQDKISQQLALRLDLLENQHKSQFRVADGGYLKSYRFSVVDEESVETVTGRFKSLKLSQTKGEKRDHSTLWMARELGFLPVRIERIKGDSIYRMTLESVTWDSATTGQ